MEVKLTKGKECYKEVEIGSSLCYRCPNNIEHKEDLNYIVCDITSCACCTKQGTSCSGGFEINEEKIKDIKWNEQELIEF